MKVQNGWVSEYRRQRFLDHHNGSSEEYVTPRTITIMLDLDGTCDNIDSKKAQAFLKQVDFIRMKLGANMALVMISTHACDSTKMKKVLDVLSPELPSKVGIGKCFYLSGIYDYQEDREEYVHVDFNLDKVRTFLRYYIYPLQSRNIWFSIVDDGASHDLYKEFQFQFPMCVFHPSQRHISPMNDNFMNVSTPTLGFDGVIECFDQYIQTIRNLSLNKIESIQKSMVTPLTSMELIRHLEMGHYDFVVQYYEEGLLGRDDMLRIIQWIDQMDIEVLSNSERDEIHFMMRSISGMDKKVYQKTNNLK